MTAIVWFRNDLRILDNPALYEACKQHDTVIPLYIQEPNPPLPLGEAQAWWLHHSLQSLGESLQQKGLQLCLKSGDALAQLNQLIEKHRVSSVYWNNAHDPKNAQRDEIIKAALRAQNIQVKTFNANLLINVEAIKTQDGSFYKVFTPFWKACKKQITIQGTAPIESWPSTPVLETQSVKDWRLLPKSPDWSKGFGNLWQPGEVGAQDKLTKFIDKKLGRYPDERDIPSAEATSMLSPHLHFGEISPHQIWHAIKIAEQFNNIKEEAIESYLSQLGWREFSYYLLHHFPKLPTKNFRSRFDHFPWQENENALRRWQKGQTGYPIVDAGMRELWETGYMHNRVRMIVASFLTKDLLIDWRQGAQWFFNTLLDADLANNSASWQWVAGSGVDAAPYFRIFNPILQGEKFDPEGKYVKHWIPELRNVPTRWVHKPWQAKELASQYPSPIVFHDEARKAALAAYKYLSRK